MSPLTWLVRKDLARFLADRPGALLTLVLPLVLATLLSLILAPALGPLSVDLLVVDHDPDDPRTAALIEALAARPSLTIERVGEEEARRRVAEGNDAVALILPEATGRALGLAGLTADTRPTATLLYDPSRGAEVDLVAGTLLEVTLDRVLDSLPGDGTPRLRPPLDVERHALVGNVSDAPFDIHAHLFAGMLTMFALFLAIEQARHFVAERTSGTLLRLCLSGTARWKILLATALSTALLTLTLTAALYATGMLLFGIGVRGSLAGFALVVLALSTFAGAFALMLAGVARSERQLVNLGTALVLLASFAGGSWVPAFILPDWLDAPAHALPTWWANRGLAAMTWRGHDLSHALTPTLALLAASAVAAVIGLVSWRWEPR